MLELIQKKLHPVPKRFLLLLYLLLYSCFLHSIFLCVMLLLWSYAFVVDHSLVISHNMRHAPICVIPLQKTITGSLANVAMSHATSHTNHAASQTKKNATHKNTVVAQPVTKKNQEKPAVSAPLQKTEERPLGSATAIETKKNNPERNKPIVQEKKSQKNTRAVDEQSQQHINNNVSAFEPMTDAVIAIGYQDAVLLKQYEHIQQHIEQEWHPPAGVTTQTGCVMRVATDSQGALIDISVVESSGIITYDIAARMALMRVEYPKLLWGQTLTIAFK